MRDDRERDMLVMALAGYQIQAEEIRERIAELQQALGHTVGHTRLTPVRRAPGAKHHVLSPAARKRIAAAQKKRWSAYHKAQKSKAKGDDAAAAAAE